MRQMSLKKPVVLVGMMGSGKTAIGRALSLALDVPFKDSDSEMALAANMSVSEIFKRDGETFFRAAETRIISRLLSDVPCILATGGGVFMNAENRSLISKIGVSVLLEVDLDLLWERVRNKKSRPLLNTKNPRETLVSIYNKRKDFYNMADMKVKATAGNSIAQTTQCVVDKLLTRPDIFGDKL